MKKRLYSTCFILLVFSLCVGILVASHAIGQFSGFTIAPPNSAIGYGGFFNPYGNNSLNPILGFGNPTLTFDNPALNLGGLGLGLNNPLGSLSLLGFNYLNPLALSPLAGITPGISTSLGAISPARTAAQTGTWTGTWTSTFVAFPIL